MPSSVITKHSKSGPRSKPLHFYVNADEVAVIDWLAKRFNTEDGLPVSRSLVVRRALEVLTAYARVAPNGLIELPRGRTMVRTLREPGRM